MLNFFPDIIYEVFDAILCAIIFKFFVHFKEFPYLKVIFNKKKNTADKNVKLIDESITCHFKALKGLPLGKNYFFNLNPDFVLELVKEYMAFAPNTVQSGQITNDFFKTIFLILFRLFSL